MLLKTATFTLFASQALASSRDGFFGDTGLEYTGETGIANHESAGLCKNRQFLSTNSTVSTCKSAYGLECLHNEMVFKIYKGYLEDLRELSTSKVNFNIVNGGDGYNTTNCDDGLVMTSETDTDGDTFYRYSFSVG